ncbi:MAG TPA: hypothetical protein VNZ86_00165, partial [Bacteroidia bacterium]|nr:hypothetical protein [Bacteroidia bacterium]
DINVILGYQRLRRSYKGLVFDFFCGGGYKNYQAVAQSSPGIYRNYSLKDNLWLYSPLSLCGGITIGWGFCRNN